MLATMASKSSRAAVAVLVLAACVALSCADGNGGEAFGYAAGSATGPENWAKLSPENKLCGEGKRQSPVDVVTKQAVSAPNLDSLDRTYADTNATLTNNGHDISMTFAGKVGTITVGGKVYSLVKLHWHMPSEHTVNGQRFPLEMHLVHKSDAGDLAVIGILYEHGAPDSFYFQLKNKLRELAKETAFTPAEAEAQVAAGLVHMRPLQKRTGSYFRYSGSLTTPPCTENVVWNILGKVREISKEQLDLLRAVAPSKHSSARPPQPLNGRLVQFYNPPNSTISFPV